MLDCPHCHQPATWVQVEMVGPVLVAQVGSDGIEVVPERLIADCQPCGHKTVEVSPDVWVLAECQKSEIGLHLWREEYWRIAPVEEFCAACGSRCAKTAVS